MHPLLGQEMAAVRISDSHSRAARHSMVKEARAAKRRPAKQVQTSRDRFVPSGALRLGRAIRRLRSKPATQSVTC